MRQKKKNFYLIIFAVVFILFFVSLIYRLRAININKTPSLTESDSIRIIPEPSNNDHVLWEGSSGKVVVEYFDIDCKYCRALLLKEDELSDTIKKEVRLIYRWFPLLDLYPRSLERAIIAECVSREEGDGTFFNFLRTVSRSYQEDHKDNSWLLSIANDFVKDKHGFEECTTKKLTLEKIKQDRKSGYIAGIFSVPSFLIAEKNKPIVKFDLLGPITGSRLLMLLANRQ